MGKPFDAEVYGYNYVKKDGAVSLLWKITDFERECPLDLYAGFLKKSSYFFINCPAEAMSVPPH
jgi:hypothetical protein